MTWQYEKLGDVSDMLVGFSFKSKDFIDASDEGVKLVRGDNVQQGFIRWGDKAKKWREDEYESLSRFQLQKDDVILAMDRPIVGGGLKLAWIKEQDIPSLLVQRVTRIRGIYGAALTNFLRYALSSPDFIAHIEKITTGANIPHISGKNIANFEFRLPSLPEQEKIVEIILAYDDLIETNQRRIALLEESARLLYREWFLNLRFTGYELVEVLNGVPDGWGKSSVAEMSSFLARGITPKYDDSAKGTVINQKCIRNGRLNLEPARRQSKEVKPDRLVQVGDILINSTGAGTLGRVAQVRSEIPDCTVDTHVTIVRPLNEGAFSYLGVALLELEPLLETMGVGSTNQLELGRADIGALTIFQPTQNLMDEFHARVWPIFQQIENIAKSNQLLAQARDELLPKLMSGEIQV